MRNNDQKRTFKYAHEFNFYNRAIWQKKPKHRRAICTHEMLVNKTTTGITQLLQQANENYNIIIYIYANTIIARDEMIFDHRTTAVSYSLWWTIHNNHATKPVVTTIVYQLFAFYAKKNANEIMSCYPVRQERTWSER